MAIIAILAALLLPAIQQAREAARRTQCLNNIKQVNLAAANYLSSNRSYPSGWICSALGTANGCMQSAPGIGPYSTYGGTATFKDYNQNLIQIQGVVWVISPDWSWQSFMLPQMDASTTALNFSQLPGSAGNNVSLSLSISSYRCPSANEQSAGLGYCNYRGCFGTNATTSNGVFGMNSAISDRNIKDGSSTTIMFGEGQFGFWGDALSCCARVPNANLPNQSADSARAPIDWSTVGQAPNSQLADVLTGGASQGTMPAQFMIFGFGSSHQDAVMFAMADGSQRPISKSINLAVLQALATIAGSEKVTDDF